APTHVTCAGSIVYAPGTCTRPAPYASSFGMAAPPRWQFPLPHATPVRSPVDVSVRSIGGVWFVAGKTAAAFIAATSASTSPWRLGFAARRSAATAEACGVAMDVPWIVE